jgi:excisionase family DNA binding protein
MDYVLLSHDEAAALLGLSSEQVIALIDSGELGGLRVAGDWRVPLKSITRMLAVGTSAQTMRAVERVFNDKNAWDRVFGAHPEVTQSVESGAFPKGSVGALLKEALAAAN